MLGKHSTTELYLKLLGLRDRITYVAQANFELTVLLPQCPECWYMLNSRHIPPLSTVISSYTQNSFQFASHISGTQEQQGAGDHWTRQCRQTSASAAIGLSFYDETR